MAKYACSNEGVQQLQTAAGKIVEGVDSVKASTSTMCTVADNYRDTLGPHKEQLSNALMEIAKAVETCTEPANQIAQKLQNVAKRYESTISKKRFVRGGSSSESSFAGSSGGGSSQTAAGVAAGAAAGAAGVAAAGIATSSAPGGYSGWKRIEGEHDHKSDAKAVNPNFDSSALEWTNNCQRCVPAYEMRQRGYDVKATPRPTVLKKSFFTGEVEKVVTNDDHLSWHPFDAWIPPDSVPCPGGIGDIEKKMSEWGDGSRAEVMVYWQGAHGGGHVFVAQQINGITHFIDPQSGEEGVGYYFDHCITDRICICRTDDKTPSGYVMDCCA
ncbi:MAG: hypothetical protein E7307_07205 [Butyrivibrio sp.]|nr:hypothetical protein [Butyrivibrio sp.]